MDIELAQALAENEILKSLLYCTKRSCNNCGKVNCENYQRQRKDCLQVQEPYFGQLPSKTRRVFVRYHDFS